VVNFSEQRFVGGGQDEQAGEGQRTDIFSFRLIFHLVPGTKFTERFCLKDQREI